jgi:hypothetical protein
VRAFLLAFLVCQIAVWQRVQKLPPRHRLIVFFLSPRMSMRSVLVALLAGGVVTLLAIALLHLVLRPLLKLWFNPQVDSASGLFHLGADEKIIASVSARRQSGWGWHPGCLTITTRRLWFFPRHWNQEPWSVRLDEVDRIEPERTFLSELPPLRNWPQPLRLFSGAGEVVFAVADPAAVLAWFDRVEPGGEYLPAQPALRR